MQSKTFPASIRGRARNFAELSLFHTAHSLEEAKKHMTSKRLLTLAGLCVLFLSGQLHAAAKIGEAAPDFTLTDSRNQTVSLGDYKGKLVVLEWTNHECPFVRKHYDSGNMQKLQRDYTGKGVVWMSIVSSAPGKQGHVTGDEAEELTRARNAAPTAVLLDPTGKTGQSYGAKTTPHMYIIDREGVLRYAGGIDNIKSADQADIKTAKNYVAQSLDELLAGKPVSEPATAPYGCGVKY
jgi:alkyl hydroperoxide reductase subunit AhpC